MKMISFVLAFFFVSCDAPSVSERSEEVNEILPLPDHIVFKQPAVAGPEIRFYNDQRRGVFVYLGTGEVRVKKRMVTWIRENLKVSPDLNFEQIIDLEEGLVMVELTGIEIDEKYLLQTTDPNAVSLYGFLKNELGDTVVASVFPANFSALSFSVPADLQIAKETGK